MRSGSEPMATLLIPAILRPLTDGQERVEVAATTVEEAIAALQDRFAEAGARLRQAMARRYVIVSIDGQDVRALEGPRTPVRTDTEIHLLWAVAGG